MSAIQVALRTLQNAVPKRVHLAEGKGAQPNKRTTCWLFKSTKGQARLKLDKQLAFRTLEQGNLRRDVQGEAEPISRVRSCRQTNKAQEVWASLLLPLNNAMLKQLIHPSALREPPFVKAHRAGRQSRHKKTQPSDYAAVKLPPGRLTALDTQRRRRASAAQTSSMCMCMCMCMCIACICMCLCMTYMLTRRQTLRCRGQSKYGNGSTKASPINPLGFPQTVHSSISYTFLDNKTKFTQAGE